MKKHGPKLTGKALGKGIESDVAGMAPKGGGKKTTSHGHLNHAPKMQRGSAMHAAPIKHDSLIDSTHHAMNKKHGMADGFAPNDGYMNCEDEAGEGNETHD